MDPAATTPMPQAAAKPRRRRWWLRGLLALAVLALVFLGIYWYLEAAARRDWDAAVAETDALDPRWRLEDIEADRAKIPDEENSALAMINASAKGGAIFVSGAPNYERILDRVPQTTHLNPQQTELIRGKLARIGVGLGLARQLKDMPRSRFPINYSEDWTNTRIDHHNHVRRLADWLWHDACLLAHDQKGDDGVQSCLAMLNTGRSLADEPTQYNLLVRINIQIRAVIILERILAQTSATEPTLERMQAALLDESKQTKLVTEIRAERAGNHHLVENVRAGKVMWSRLSRAPNDRSPSRAAGFGLPGFRPLLIMSRYDDRRDATVRRMRQAGTTV